MTKTEFITNLEKGTFSFARVFFEGEQVRISFNSEDFNDSQKMDFSRDELLKDIIKHVSNSSFQIICDINDGFSLRKRL